MQKYVSLKLNPGHLITDGMFSKIRNTNYLGELFIYLGRDLDMDRISTPYIPTVENMSVSRCDPDSGHCLDNLACYHVIPITHVPC